MITVQTLSATVGVAEAEITRWVELTWLRPDGSPGGWLFQEVTQRLPGRVDDDGPVSAPPIPDRFTAEVRDAVRRLTAAVRATEPPG